ncbi:MAG: hypothetical protein KF729_33125 [Sandaracinaceae bacterium]|nr:hypothetical protein [Sandaracinaceae bacterium]
MRLALALGLSLGALAAARAEAQPRVLVATSPELAARIAGQTADLPVALEEASPPADFEAALALGRARAAPFVVYAREREDGLTIHVVAVAARRMLARAVDGDDRSAALEAAALIARGALRDLAEGGEVGVLVPRADDAPAPSPPPAPPAPAARASSGAVRLELGWSAALDGHAPTGVQAPSFGGLLTHERLRAGVRIEVALPVELADERAVLALWRLRPAAALAFDVLDPGEVALSVGVELGAVVWHRATSVRQAELAATDAAWSASVLVAPQLALELFPAVLGGSVGIVVAAGADILPSAPTFAYALDGAIVERAALFVVQPFARVTLAVRGG